MDVGIGTRFHGKETETQDLVLFDGVKDTERLYGDANDVIVLLENGSPRLRLMKSGWRDYVMWNIGEEKAPSKQSIPMR